MDIRTHRGIDPSLCGTPVRLADGRCRVEMTPSEQMTADDSGLIHGGFVFGMADYAAMLAVNHPNVVLAGADCRFYKPVRAGERLAAEARVAEGDEKRQSVEVRVLREDVEVFSGRFDCVVLKDHVLKDR